MTIEAVITSEKQHELRAKDFGAACPFSRKLVCSLLSKKNYTVQGSNMKHYLVRGMKLIKIHCNICYTANFDIERYITNKTKKRQQCTNYEVRRNYYKLMNNFVYGKTIKSVAKRSKIRIVLRMRPRKPTRRTVGNRKLPRV